MQGYVAEVHYDASADVVDTHLRESPGLVQSR